MFRPSTFGPVWLASRSARRRTLLGDAGIALHLRPADIDDAHLARGRVGVAEWVMALAYLKARWVADALDRERGEGPGTVLGADTLCAREGRILGQPLDAEAARGMLVLLRDATHVTMTGVCLLARPDRRRWLFVDRSIVRVGCLSDDTIDEYLDGGAWRGKAGGYNLDDRISAGWPIECEGDPATVMGLPMRRLEPWLSEIRERQR